MIDKEYKPYPDGGVIRATQIKKHPKAPDYWGEIAINLKDMTNIKVVDGLTIVKIGGWKRKDTQGKTFLSLAVDRFVPEQMPTSRPVAPPEDDFDEAPF